MYSSKDSNPFFADDDEDDFVRVEKSNVNRQNPAEAKINNRHGAGGRSSQPTYTRSDYSDRNPFGLDDDGAGDCASEHNALNDRRQNIREQMYASEDRQLESTQRALSSIYDSERMGIVTAEELLHQGEQLDNIERKTDDINQGMKTSQKHLNSIKSVFGGIKTWWSGGNKTETPVEDQQRSSKLRHTVANQAIDEHDSYHGPDGPHPGSRIRSDDGTGFYGEDDLDRRFMSAARKKPADSEMFHPITQSDREKQTDSNLSMMSDGMDRLKLLAQGLGDEIETQNEQLDRIQPKMDRSNLLIDDQNKQMRRKTLALISSLSNLVIRIASEVKVEEMLQQTS